MVVLVPELRVSVANVLKLEIFMYHSSAHASIYYLSDRVAMQYMHGARLFDRLT